MKSVSRTCLAVFFIVILSGHAAAQELRFRAQEIETELGVGYAVRLLDMNADGWTDIIVVDRNRVVWYENPGGRKKGKWRRHTIIEDQTEPDNVCLAPYDIDGDGQVDFALGADWGGLATAAGGTIQWLGRGTSAAKRWNVHPIGEEPTVHRMQWADLDGDGRKELIVVPLMGRGTSRPDWNENPVRILAFSIPPDPLHDAWPMEVLNEDLHVCHNFWPTDLDGDGRTDILVASFEGVSWLRRLEDGTWQRVLIGQGNQATRPNRGASEVKIGRLSSGADYIATIEPWHGHQVVVYTRPPEGETLWNRVVLDEQLKWGHAVWPVDLDADGDGELVIGVRDNFDENHLRGVRIYDPGDEEETRWKRILVDPGGVAVEDLAAADLNGDDRPDIVAVGRQTHNIRIYWNQGSFGPR